MIIIIKNEWADLNHAVIKYAVSYSASVYMYVLAFVLEAYFLDYFCR